MDKLIERLKAKAEAEGGVVSMLKNTRIVVFFIACLIFFTIAEPLAAGASDSDKMCELLELKSSEELLENKSGKRMLQKGLLLEFKKYSKKVLLAVAQKPGGKKN
ncbi:Exoribonuclease II [Forsythia ovata]|uniref:Exoribonuclease II n=1 Tax=Forsythia ovata TaxID=205694 RepID=A0ABD1X3Y5_9LAMI